MHGQADDWAGSTYGQNGQCPRPRALGGPRAPGEERGKEEEKEEKKGKKKKEEKEGKKKEEEEQEEEGKGY